MDQQRCRNCHSNNIRVVAMQIRAADENETEFVICSDCYHRTRYTIANDPKFIVIM